MKNYSDYIIPLFWQHGEEEAVLRNEIRLMHENGINEFIVEAQIKEGPVTMLGITQTHDGKLKMIISEGEAFDYQTLMIGNTQTHIKFSSDPDTYMDKWFTEAPTHHLAMSIGHNSKLFKKVATLMNINYVII